MDEPACYEIRVAEYLDELRAKWFGDLAIVHSESGETILRGEMADQPALFGVLGKIRDLGLTLISVKRLEEVPLSPRVSTAAPNPNDTSNEGR
jgi:hypothetical protein